MMKMPGEEISVKKMLQEKDPVGYETMQLLAMIAMVADKQGKTEMYDNARFLFGIEYDRMFNLLKNGNPS